MTEWSASGYARVSAPRSNMEIWPNGAAFRSATRRSEQKSGTFLFRFYQMDITLSPKAVSRSV